MLLQSPIFLFQDEFILSGIIIAYLLVFCLVLLIY